MDLLARVILMLGLLFGALWSLVSAVVMFEVRDSSPLPPIAGLVLVGIGGFLFLRFIRLLRQVTPA